MQAHKLRACWRMIIAREAANRERHEQVRSARAAAHAPQRTRRSARAPESAAARARAFRGGFARARAM